MYQVEIYGNCCSIFVVCKNLISEGNADECIVSLKLKQTVKIRSGLKYYETYK